MYLGWMEERLAGKRAGDQEIKVVENKIKELLENIEKILRDADKFDRGNFSAGVRVRKDLMKAVKEIKDVRQSVLDERSRRKENKEN